MHLRVPVPMQRWGINSIWETATDWHNFIAYCGCARIFGMGCYILLAWRHGPSSRAHQYHCVFFSCTLCCFLLEHVTFEELPIHLENHSVHYYSTWILSHLNSKLSSAGIPVESVTGHSKGGTVKLANGKSIQATKGIVVATEGISAAKLLGSALQDSPSTTGEAVGTCCLYFRYFYHWCPIHWNWYCN